MKSKSLNNILAVVICIAIIVLTRLSDALPWWSFVVPVLVFGGVISLMRWKVSGFLVGFLAGFIIWFGVNAFYDAQNDGLILGRVTQLISVPKLVTLLIAGALGGLLSGLALYTGKGLLSYRPSPVLDDNVHDNSL